MSNRQQVKEWDVRSLPDFKGRRVFILPGPGFAQTTVLFAQAGWTKAHTLEEAELVVFLGGSDVNPRLYGQKPIKGVAFHEDRDLQEKKIFEQCVERGVPMFGICRGAQFLHVMNGGTLWQDVNGHGGKDHPIIDLDTSVRVLSNSYHHQMIRVNDKITLVAVCEHQVATKYEDQHLLVDLNRFDEKGRDRIDDIVPIEVEAGAYEDTRCFFVQGHPECGPLPYQAWTMHRLKEFVEGIEDDTYCEMVNSASLLV